VTVSTITYGTMRLLPERFSEDAILDLFLYALDAGITTYHVSHEYESYPAVCRALRRARAERPSIAIEIVAKIGQPHFDEVDFDSDRFQLLIERTLADLDVPTVDIVQWLVRHTPNEDAPRIAILERNADSIESLWSDLLTIGRVRALGVFPYSDAFLQSALKLPCVDGVVSYYNERERELEPFFDALAMAGRSILGIRPLCAGSIREEADALKALQFALAPEPPVAGTIIGLSSRAQIDAAIASALTVRR
jgi:aryl-alcohol dehydrogenase-like predicted oxidoreductase